MARFFVDEILGDSYILKGDDARHAIKSLRMKVDEEVTLCSKDGMEYLCRIEKIENQEALLKVVSKSISLSEPKTKVCLYQAMPKSDKFDLIVQKSVELGVDTIVPVMTSRCISRPDNKSLNKKIDRLNKISKEAAKQSRRGKVPKVFDMINLNDIKDHVNRFDKFIVFYENGGEKFRNLVDVDSKNIAILVGPEGGFSKEEIEFLKEIGVAVATLGPRILRTETAPLMALSIIMELTGNI